MTIRKFLKLCVKPSLSAIFLIFSSVLEITAGIANLNFDGGEAWYPWDFSLAAFNLAMAISFWRAKVSRGKNN